MSRKFATLALGLGLIAGLGCSGIGETVMDLAGAEVVTGEDAVHPVDFALPPPPVGTIETVVSADFAGIDTTSVVYKLPEDADIEAILATYEELLKGLTSEDKVTRQEQDGSIMVSADLGGGKMLNAGTIKNGAGTLLTLVAVTSAL